MRSVGKTLSPARLALVAAAAIFLTTAAFGQCPAPSWSAMNVVPGVFGQGSSPIQDEVTWDPDGAGPLPPVVVVIGGFAGAGAVAANGIATWDGTSWSALPGVPGGSNALGVYNGDLIAGSNPGVYRWNGSSWVQLGSLSGSVSAFGTYNGDLIAGAPSTPGTISRWNGTTWTTIGTLNGLSHNVSAIAEYNGELYVTGNFSDVSGVAAASIARWNGTSWSALGSGLGGINPIGAYGKALEIYNGELVVAGWLIGSAGGIPTAGLARWNGTSWLAFPGIQIPYPGLVTLSALAVFGGELVVGGSFTLDGGTVPIGVARWNGASWQSLGSGLKVPLPSPNNGPNVAALTVCNGGLFVGGVFDTAGGIDAHRIARWDGVSWSSLGTGTSFAPKSLGTYNGELIVGGPFLGSFGVGANGIARWNGSAWAALGSGLTYVGSTAWGSASAVTVYNGDLIAGGDFTMAGGSTAFHVARWNGTSWSALGGGLLGNVTALTTYGGELIAGGGFVTAGGGGAVNNIARWNGSQWLPLGAGIGGAVAALVVHGTDLIATGAFTSAGGNAVNNIAKWDGVSWQPLGGSGLTGGYGLALAVYESNVVVGGTFVNVSGVPVYGIARFDGVAWHSLANVINVNGGVRALAVLDGELFAGSSSWLLPGGTTYGVARWNGTSWQSLGTGMDSGIAYGASSVSTLTAFDGALIAGGLFLTAGGVGTPLLARWSSPRPILALTQSGGPGTGVTVNNHWLVPGHEYYNLASLDPCAGGPGTGPYGGLCFADPATLINQLLAPIGAVPFHFVAGASNAAFGPFLLPPGLSVEALSADVTGGVIGCISPVTAFTVQ